MSKVYCGTGKLKKGSKYGTMKECIKTHQIRLYGLKKIDPEILKQTKKLMKKTSSAIRSNIIKKIMRFKGKINRLQKDLRYEKTHKNDKKVIKKINDEISSHESQIKKLYAELKEYNKQKEELQKRIQKISKKNKKKKNKKINIFPFNKTNNKL